MGLPADLGADLIVSTFDRITVNLTADDVELDVEDVDELVERSECSSRSELIRRLLAEELDDDLDEPVHK